jgi:hypothetical protein
LAVIVNRYAQVTPEDTQSDTDKEDQEEIRPVKLIEAITALELLNLYEKQQDDGQSEVIRKLDSLKWTLV